MRSQHTIDACRSGNYNGMDFDKDYAITFSYLPGAAPIIHPVDNLRFGVVDPGWDAEIEFVSITPDAGDRRAFRDLAQQGLEEWARDWLDDHYDECIEIAEAARQPDPDAARDQRIDDELMNRND